MSWQEDKYLELKSQQNWPWAKSDLVHWLISFQKRLFNRQIGFSSHDCIHARWCTNCFRHWNLRQRHIWYRSQQKSQRRADANQSRDATIRRHATTDSTANSWRKQRNATAARTRELVTGDSDRDTVRLDGQQWERERGKNTPEVRLQSWTLPASFRAWAYSHRNRRSDRNQQKSNFFSSPESSRVRCLPLGSELLDMDHGYIHDSCGAPIQRWICRAGTLHEVQCPNWCCVMHTASLLDESRSFPWQIRGAAWKGICIWYKEKDFF